MKTKTIVTTFLAVLLASMFLLSPVYAACNLPPTATVTVGPGNPPVQITLSFSGSGYDVTSGQSYTGYCIELGAIVVQPIEVTLICTDAAGSPWNQINWLLNNYPDSLDVQFAIWRLQGHSQAFIESGGWAYTAAAEAMYTAASAHATFDPSAGQWVGVRLVTDGGQDLLIKIQIPEQGEGLTPGFWKNHPEAWAPTGYSTSQTVNSVFSGAGSLGSSTLLQALSFQGGNTLNGAKGILLRAAVAALLNSASPTIDYPLTTAQVISQVNAALASNNRGTILTLASQLDYNNNLGDS